MTSAMVLVFAVMLATEARTASAQRSKEKTKSARSTATSQKRTLDTTVTVERGTVLDLSATSAKITVRGWDRSAVEVHATTDIGMLDFAHASRRVRLEVGAGGQRRDDEATVLVRAPKGTRVVISSRQGDVEIFDVGGELDANVVAGDISVRGGVGRTSVSMAAGDVRMVGVDGPVRLDAISGDITLSNVRGDIEITATSSTVLINAATANRAQVSVVSGEITYDGTLAPTGRYEFTTHAGDVHLFILPSSRGTLEVQSFSGELHSAIPLTSMPETSPTRNSLRGASQISLRRPQHLQFGGGSPGDGAEIKVSTFNGDLHIARGPRRAN